MAAVLVTHVQQVGKDGFSKEVTYAETWRISRSVKGDSLPGRNNSLHDAPEWNKEHHWKVVNEGKAIPKMRLEGWAYEPSPKLLS